MVRVLVNRYVEHISNGLPKEALRKRERNKKKCVSATDITLR